MNEKSPSVDPGLKDALVPNPHDQRIIDYAMHAATAAVRVTTEEIVTRNRVVVSTEIQKAFESYTKITTAKRVAMIAGGIAAFGLGWLIKGWVSPYDEETETNGVSHTS